MAGEVFISYDREDRAYVDRLVAHLRSFGVPVWVDRDIPYGEDWDAVIEARIETCTVLLPVVTPASRESSWAKREIQLAENLRKPILPLLLAGAIGLRLGITQYEDVTDGSMPSRRFVDQLLALCGLQPGQPPVLSDPPPVRVDPPPVRVDPPPVRIDQPQWTGPAAQPEPARSAPPPAEVPIRMSTTYPAEWSDPPPKARTPWPRWLTVLVTFLVTGTIATAGVIWIVNNVGPDHSGAPETSGPTAPAFVDCVWLDPPTTAGPTTPAGLGRPATHVPAKGSAVLKLTTNRGPIEITMDRAKAPCTVASLTYLAGKGYYDNTSCHRLAPGIASLQCGDPTGTGEAWPGYRFKDENLPKTSPAYEEGDVAMANSGANNNGSQFFFVYGPNDLQGGYSLVGTVTKGVDVIKVVGAAGFVTADGSTGGGKPKLTLTLTSARTAGG